jgi:hypothetical protein
MKYIHFALVSCLIGILYSCHKKQPDNCQQIQQVRITGAKAGYYVGDSISLTTNLLPAIALFTWNQGTNPNTISGNHIVFIYPCSKANEGWYYLNVSFPDCAAKQDSVYISVKNKPATAPCSPVNNTVSFSYLPDINAISVTWSMDGTYNRKKLRGVSASALPDLNVYFNLYWNTSEPEDGEYDVAGESTLSNSDPYSVHITSLYSSIFFRSNSGKLYVTHVNGKMQVKFCGVNLSGTNGSTSFNSTATGMLTAP